MKLSLIRIPGDRRAVGNGDFPGQWRNRKPPALAPASRRRCTPKWGADYHKAAGVEINYQSVGSGAGLRQIEAKTVDLAPPMRR